MSSGSTSCDLLTANSRISTELGRIIPTRKLETVETAVSTGWYISACMLESRRRGRLQTTCDDIVTTRINRTTSYLNEENVGGEPLTKIFNELSCVGVFRFDEFLYSHSA